jgi:NAD(P)-dependent dehydrogenase (short-subunit alcohol dehydrogenase family)
LHAPAALSRRRTRGTGGKDDIAARLFGSSANARAPSITLTERIRPHWDKSSQVSNAEEIELTPLRRVAEAVDQANVISFLASADADFVAGLTIDVTGGQWIHVRRNWVGK